MATVRKMWVCKNKECRTAVGKHRGYKKVCTGEKKALCKHCGLPMALNENHTARVQVDGRVVTKTLTANKKDAEAYISEVKTAARVGNLLPGEEKRITWIDAKQRFESWMDDPGANEGLRPKTATFYRSRIKPLEVEFVDRVLGRVCLSKMSLQDIQKKHVDAWKSWRISNGLAASTVNGSLATLKRMYTVVCSQERAALTPRLHEAKTDIFKVALLELDNTVDLILETGEEINVLLDQCKTPHLYHFVFGILNTGLRHDDMLKLKTSEISFHHNKIVTSVKGGTRVEIPLTGPYRAYLEEWIKSAKVRSINGYLIPSRKNKEGRFGAESNIGFGTACENAAKLYDQKAIETKNKHERHHLNGIAEKFRNLTPHCLRHTFATHFIYKAGKEIGASAAIQALSTILGHSSVWITERYKHALSEVNQQAMANFGAQMFSITESR